MSFIDLLKQVQSYGINAYEHQDIPFEQLVETLRITNAVNRHPLFQVMLVCKYY